MKRIEKIVRFLSVGKSRVEKITNLANKSAKKNKSRILYFLFAGIHILNGTDHNHCITIFHLIVSRYALFTPTHPFQWRQMKQTTQIRKYIKKKLIVTSTPMHLFTCWVFRRRHIYGKWQTNKITFELGFYCTHNGKFKIATSLFDT